MMGLVACEASHTLFSCSRHARGFPALPPLQSALAALFGKQSGWLACRDGTVRAWDLAFFCLKLQRLSSGAAEILCLMAHQGLLFW